MNAIEGAVIVSGFVENEEGLHLCFADGRVLIIAGVFTVGLMKRDVEKLH